jgi:hypothetical protein
MITWNFLTSPLTSPCRVLTTCLALYSSGCDALAESRIPLPTEFQYVLHFGLTPYIVVQRLTSGSEKTLIFDTIIETVHVEIEEMYGIFPSVWSRGPAALEIARHSFCYRVKVISHRQVSSGPWERASYTSQYLARPACVGGKPFISSWLND